VKRGALFLLLALGLAGCGGGNGALENPPATTMASTGTVGCAPFGGTTGAVKSSSAPSQTMLLTAVRIDSDSCRDRVVFDFKDANGAEPGYLVEYRPAAQAQTEDASGKHIAIDGKAFLVIRFEPAATADLSGATLDQTYTGPRTIKPGGMNWVKQVSKTGDFEAVLTWAIGLSEQRAFKVTSEPSRLTVELG
jgi:hypothetical protein